MTLPFELRTSPIHGQGVFALRRIRKGRRLIEYAGERITPEAADLRYDDDAMDRPHTFLFTVDARTVIDAAVSGNQARFVNHSCDPNCEAVDNGGRIFIEALRNIRPGEELTYDYHLEREGRWRREWVARYACRCGAPSCRGTLLVKPKRPKKQRL
jgi:SET domain-containing protein